MVDIVSARISHRDNSSQPGPAAAACGSGSDTRDSGTEWTVSVLTAWALTYQGLEKFLRCLKLFTESNRSDYVALSLSLSLYWCVIPGADAV